MREHESSASWPEGDALSVLVNTSRSPFVAFSHFNSIHFLFVLFFFILLTRFLTVHSILVHFGHGKKSVLFIAPFTSSCAPILAFCHEGNSLVCLCVSVCVAASALKLFFEKLKVSLFSVLVRGKVTSHSLLVS